MHDVEVMVSPTQTCYSRSVTISLQAFPNFAACPSLATVRLRNMPPFGKADLTCSQALESLSMSFSYAAFSDTNFSIEPVSYVRQASGCCNV
jgi:hypothetical protein